METSLDRRGVLYGIAGTALASLGGASIGSRPALAGAGWGTGPKSGLPFWNGGYSDLAELVALLPAGRGLDLVGSSKARAPTSQWRPRTSSSGRPGNGT